MDERPTSRGIVRPGNARLSTPMSVPDSVGVETVAPSVSFNPSIVAEEVAEDMTLGLLDGIINMPPPQTPDGSGRPTSSPREQLTALRSLNEQLKSELASARNELEFASLKEEELENRHEVAQKTIQELQKHIERLVSDLQKASKERQEARDELDKSSQEKKTLYESAAASKADAAIAREDLAVAKAELEACKHHAALHPCGTGNELMAGRSREQSLEEECSVLRDQVFGLQQELSSMQMESTTIHKGAGPSTTTDLPPEASEETPLLAAAYQQISVLNTQMAHLYTELTMARTEAQHLKTQQMSQGTGDGAPRQSEPSNTGASITDVQKQSQQIADLVSDIRHLQLDLEYHQQKLDQMIGEKQQMMKDLKKVQGELAEAKLQVEERDQMLKHRDVDLEHLKKELKGSTGGPAGGEAINEGTVAALRAEAAAKDSALIVSHYELHKEKLLRDRLEQKNLKLMERMQKLMMVVETMRKDNVSLERSLATKERAYEERELQLRRVTQKAKQLQKSAKVAKGAHRDNKMASTGPPLELESVPQQGLPPLERSQRSINSAGGNRSGMSTPRTPRAPPSPYTLR